MNVPADFIAVPLAEWRKLNDDSLALAGVRAQFARPLTAEDKERLIDRVRQLSGGRTHTQEASS